MTQKNTVLKLLADSRTVSKLIAVHLNIGNLMEVIRRLRNDGWWIVTRTDMDGNGNEFARYELIDGYEKQRARRTFANAA